VFYFQRGVHSADTGGTDTEMLWFSGLEHAATID
jgi:hypothetical protein